MKYEVYVEKNLPSLEQKRLANDCNKAQEEIQKVTLLNIKGNYLASFVFSYSSLVNNVKSTILFALSHGLSISIVFKYLKPNNSAICFDL